MTRHAPRAGHARSSRGWTPSLAGRLPDPSPVPRHGSSVERPAPDRRSRPATPHAAWLDGVEAVRAAIGRGEIYQANLARRLEAPFDGDPWPLFRRLRTGDPALFAGYLDLGAVAGHRRARAPCCPRRPSRSSRWTGSGTVSTDPIKGTRPRGRTRAEDRALARELLASRKDQAENVMIVDVLRNDLGRVCEPGSVRVPRLLRLERTAAVQHLVTTVTGRLRAGTRRLRPARRRVPRRVDHGRAQDPGDGGHRAAWSRSAAARTAARCCGSGPDGRMGSSILIRTFVADGERLTLHVGGGITWRSDPEEEWDETVAKARGPLSSIGAVEVERVSDARPALRLGRRRACARPTAPHLSVFDRGFQLGDGIFETLRARGGPRRRSSPSTSPASAGRRTGSRSSCPTGVEALLARGIADLLAAEGLDGPDGDASVRITVVARRVGIARPPAAADRAARRRRSSSRHGRSSPAPPTTSSAACRWWCRPCGATRRTRS